ncbi:DUF7511 domain-containing protein [Natrarchaeobaculum aegyptiacum]|uniref:DUF7511 domain-containing protein n=1 Tax=Natrarchaeobaculum aegyptiacum TaxID=745377 RepID=A0A2Z2HVM2_9EURY|nr:hypothetical protein [Natrarchaeobaculum aegyptiacum]ARS91262.1 hypothetical protein B1756_17060 [Natrarchaeobaculum aegyptiacum]
MTIHDSHVPHGGRVQADGEELELLTDDADVWTVVPVEATGDERVCQWISVDAETLCDLEEWR